MNPQHQKNTIGNIHRASTLENTFTRRQFLNAGCLAGFLLATGTSVCSETKENTVTENWDISFALITDLHYADKETWGTRYYCDSDDKLRECIDIVNQRKPAFMIELGDLVDKADKETELSYLRTINGIFSEFVGERHYVIGNHCVATFSKDEFIGHTSSRGNHYSFDHGDFHFVVLDANYNKDGSDYNAGNFNWTETYIHTPQQEWLTNDLTAARGKTAVIFVHQNLHDETNDHGVKNAPEIRRILEDSGIVTAVFQGHDHKGGYAEIGGIHYVTFRAAVEGSGLASNAFALVHMNKNGKIWVEGLRKQRQYTL